MPEQKNSIVNIALVGGGGRCKEVLKKTTFNLAHEDVSAPVPAVAESYPP